MTSQPMMGFTTMSLSCILMAVLLCLPGLVWLWARVLRKPKHCHAVCGQCQYIVEGLQTMFCPECGSDFRKVGIEMPHKRGRVEPVTFLALWTLLLGPVALCISGFIIAIGHDLIVSSLRDWLGLIVLIFWMVVYLGGMVLYWHLRVRRAADETSAAA